MYISESVKYAPKLVLNYQLHTQRQNNDLANLDFMINKHLLMLIACYPVQQQKILTQISLSTGRQSVAAKNITTMALCQLVKSLEGQVVTKIRDLIEHGDDRMGNFSAKNDWKVTLLLIKQSKSLILPLPYQYTTVKPTICSNAFQWVV
jgi:hypothetical protein